MGRSSLREVTSSAEVAVKLRRIRPAEGVGGPKQPVVEAGATARQLLRDEELLHQAAELLGREDDVLHVAPQKATCEKGESGWGEQQRARVMDGDRDAFHQL